MTTATEPQPSKTLPLAGKVALVTGGTRGIGAAISHRLAADGAHVAAGYWRHHEPAEKFMASMNEEYPGTITVHHGNIGAADDCRRVVREVIEQHGRLDILVNNAGITIDKTVAKMGDEDWSRVISINLSGAFFVAQAALEQMLQRGTGRIISISSAVGEIGQHRAGELRGVQVRAVRADQDAGPGGRLHAEPVGRTRSATAPG